MKKFIAILLSIAFIAAMLGGCSSSDASIDFIYPFSADVNSYDPQVAGTTDEFLIIENTFEGLIRIDDDGTVKKGVADSWTVSDDGLTYTFNLKKGIKWNIDTSTDDDGNRKEDSRLEYMGYDFNPDITANDFVFALQRAAKPETNCPLFSSIACIKNAVAIHNGNKKPSSLGVKAVDDYTLVITLSTADDSFMTTLTTAVAMPCNEEFFEATKGRYGLSTEYTLFNGQFYVSQILESSYLLKKNKLYTGDYPANASELTLKISSDDDKSDMLDKLDSGYYDAVFITGEDTDSIKSSGITYTPYNDTTWAFLFNTNNEVFQSKTMRKAFCLGLTRLENTGKDYLSNATNLIPSSCTIGANSAVDAIGATALMQNADSSISLWKKGLEMFSDTEFTITVITTEGMENYVKKMLQGVQSGIGSIVKNDDGDTVSFTIKIEAVTEDELKSAVASKDYDIAFYPFKSTTNSAITYLKGFSENNLTGFDTDTLDSSLASAEQAGNIASAAKSIKKAEKSIINTYTICPMLYETSYYAMAKGVSGVQFHAGTGRVSFVNATRTK